jgi:hypothetical protein
MSVGYLTHIKNRVQKIEQDKIDVRNFHTNNDYDGKLIQDKAGRIYRFNASKGRYESVDLDNYETSRVMTKAEFEALAEQRRKYFGGSGFIKPAKTQWTGQVYSAFFGYKDDDVHSGLAVPTSFNAKKSIKNAFIIDWYPAHLYIG